MCIEDCARYHHSEAYSCNCIDKTKTFYREGSALPAAEWHHDLTLHRGWMHSGAKFVSVCKKALSCPLFPIMHRCSILFHSELSPDGVVSQSDITPWHHTIRGCSCMTSPSVLMYIWAGYRRCQPSQSRAPHCKSPHFPEFLSKHNKLARLKATIISKLWSL